MSSRQALAKEGAQRNLEKAAKELAFKAAQLEEMQAAAKGTQQKLDETRVALKELQRKLIIDEADSLQEQSM